MKIAIALLITALFTFNIYATCQYTNDSIKVNWTAFKTPKKVGVKGTFSKVKLTPNKTSGTIAEILQGSQVTINTKRVDTGDKARDGKIATFFFSTMNDGKKIVTKIVKADDKTITLDIKMNGVSQQTELPYTVKDGTLTANGKIDVLNFAMDKQLAAITKACFAKHEGKTWPDVLIGFSAQFVCK